MPIFDPKIARATWTAALTVLLLAVIYVIRETLVVFAIALLFAYLLYPLVDQISRRIPSGTRTPALALTYVLILGLLVAIGSEIGAIAATQARQLISRPPDVQGFIDGLTRAHPSLSPLVDMIQRLGRQQLGELASAAPRLSLRVLAVSANLIELIIIPILSFFILKDGRQIRDAFVSLFRTAASRAEAERTLAQIHELLLQYMRALLILCCIVLSLFGIVLTSMGVPYALLLASIAFLCEFVPLVGPITAAVVILGVSALSGYPHVWWLVAFLAAFRLIQDYIVSPRLMSHGVELHPMLVIFGVLAGAQLGGVAGVFLSVPLLALARLVLQRLGQHSTK